MGPYLQVSEGSKTSSLRHTASMVWPQSLTKAIEWIHGFVLDSMR